MDQPRRLLDDALIARYIAGECSEADRCRVLAQIAASQADADAVRAAERVWALQGHSGVSFHEEILWRRIAREVHRDANASRFTGFGITGFRRRWFALPLAASLTLVVAIYVLSGRSGIRASRALVLRDSTARGERKAVSFPDGTRAELAADSRVVYSETPDAHRSLDVVGEVYLTVAHDRLRPFVMHAGGVTVRDIGTRYLVRAYPSDQNVQVLVADGAIAIQSGAGGREVVLGPGTLGTVTPSGSPSVVSGVDTAGYLAWMRGELVFRNTPLDQVLNDLAHWYDFVVVLRDPGLASTPIRGSLPTTNMDDALDALASAAGAHWRRRGRTVAFDVPKTRHRNLTKTSSP